jgi:D-beta-D-heptose 7-phosphate kinase/D-beta-D-heptose 1-phosphate adenosyltransferase
VAIIRRAKANGRRVVFTNGCFDLLHAGHVRMLEQAKRCGDLLVVGINSDRSVRALKGPARPVVNQRDRALIVAALKSVDHVTIFDEATPERLIAHLKPDVLVKGGDWSREQIVGRDIVEGQGGRVVRLPLLQGRSSSGVVERILRTHARRAAAGGRQRESRA